ncbi:BGTF surface domain-containing protein [Salinarchaeum chitinilyticum]
MAFDLSNVTGSSNTEYTIVDSSGSTQGVFTTGADGHAVVSTATLADGQYEVLDTDGDNVTKFRVTTQSFEASADGSTITLDSSNRGGPFLVNVSSDDLTDTEIEDALGANSDQQLQVWGGLNNETTVEINTTVLDAGNYSVQFDVADTTASASANFSVDAGLDEDATFGAQQYSGVVGDNMTFTIEPSGSPGEVFLNISADGGYYDATLNLSDVGGDPVTVTWNTHLASENGSNLGFSAENATVEGVYTFSGDAITNSDHLVNQQADFEFETYVNDPINGEGEFRDVAAVRLTERSTDGATVWTAPGPGADGFSHSDTSGALAAATQTDTIAAQDLLIVEVEANGIYGYMNDQVGTFNQTGGLNLTLSQTASGPYGSADSVHIGDIAGSATLVQQPDNGTFYVLIDSTSVPGLATGESWDATFSIHESNPYVDSEESVNDSFSYAQRNIEIQGLNDNDTLVLPASSDAELTAETNVAPGTSVNSRMNFPFQFVTASGEVAEDGTFTATVDLSAFDSGTQFTTRVSAPSSATEHSVDSVIGTGTGTIPASFSVEASANGPVTVGDSASLEYTITNDGDEAGTVNYTVTVGGEEVVSNSTELEAGGSVTMTYEDFDTGSAGDISWEVSTGDDAASGTLTVNEESTGDDGGDDGTGDDGTGDDGTGDDGTGDSDGDSDSDSDGGQPGFGLVVALFALIGAALLALRRQN